MAHYDAIVIGSGQAGGPLSQKLADRGWAVALVETDRILGAAILASEGGEVVQILHAVMLAGAPYTLLKGAVYIHPTLAEGLWTLMEAVTAV